MHTTKDDLKNFETLKKRADFLRVQTKGQRWTARGVTLIALENDLDIIRAGYTVTKRLEKSAVRRNRIKRRLRAAAADTLSQKAKTGMDYVLIARSATLNRAY